MGRRVAGVGLLLLALSTARAAGIEELGPIEIRGRVHRGDQISGIARVGERLVVGADEGTAIQVLDRVEPFVYRARKAVIPLLESETEIDLEGLAARGSTVYALGSHSLKRKRLSPERSRRANRARMREVVAEPSRDHVFRLDLDPETGKPRGEVESISLRSLLERDPILGRFTSIPGKENGVDLEGVAVDGDRLYLGFRSPVLRHNLVPVLVLNFDRPQSYELLFVDLRGRGIRDLARVRDGFLVIAGPPGGATAEFELLFWDGEDQVPAMDRAAGELHSWGPIPTPAGAKAEALAVLHETDEAYVVVLAFEGPADGSPTRFRLDKDVSARP